MVVTAVTTLSVTSLVLECQTQVAVWGEAELYSAHDDHLIGELNEQ